MIRMYRAPPRRRDGFTVIELVIAMALAGVIAGMGFTLLQVGSRVERSGWRRGDAVRSRNGIEGSLGAELARAAAAGFSSPNVGVVRIDTLGPPGEELDRITFVTARGPAVPLAALSCRSGDPGCFVVGGDHRSRFPVGALLAVGSAPGGYRLVQVAAAPDSYAAPCPDCPAAWRCTAEMAPAVAVTVVRAGTSSTGTSRSCESSYTLDGSRCEETRETETTGPRLVERCGYRERLRPVTEVRFADRTAEPLGFPAPPTWIPVAVGGSPAPAAVPIDVVRYRGVGEGESRHLVAENGLTPAGGWSGPSPVAGPLVRLRAESRHRADAAWARGDGVAPGALTAAGANPTDPTDPWLAAGKGVVFERGYHTLTGVRILAAISRRTDAGGTVADEVAVTASLRAASDGGVRGER